MTTTPEELRNRTKTFAVRIVRLFQALPNKTEAQVIGKQLLRSGTSVAANYRAVYRARSRADFVSKLGVVLEEADEAVFWIELLGDTELLPRPRLDPILNEAKELSALFGAAQYTARNNGRR